MKPELANRTHPAITPDHLRRLAVIYLRQSTPEQVQRNTGSAEFQRSLAGVARSYGWPDSQIRIIDDLGKSGTSIEGRTGWQSLQEMIEAKQVGAVFVANISRLSRQVLDFELFRIRAAMHHVLLYSDGRFSNPADSNDAILSQIGAMVAQFENRKRATVMMQSRLAKAKRGEVVSQLPVGWIKGPDGKYDYDPVAKDTIHLVIETFWQTRTIRQTVKALIETGVQMPFKEDHRIHETRPTMQQVRKILTDTAYSGTYTYGKTRAQPGSCIAGGARSKPIKLPEERWTKIPDHHPPYLSREEQEKIKAILKNNHLTRRYPVRRPRALTQGLLRCAVCGAALAISYPSKGYSFSCGGSVRYAGKPCVNFSSNELEDCILGKIFKALKTPPIEMLRSALDASRAKEQTRLSWIASERERLARAEQSAQERADLTRGGLPRVHFVALEKLEKVIQERKQFEDKIALAPVAPNNESEEELEELCRIASDVPALWQHEAVHDEERKKILTCLIDHIAVGATKERIDATIFWKSGGQTPFYVWRRSGRHHLIRELHSQGLTASEIKEHLAAGKTPSGQVLNLGMERIYIRLKMMGLKAAQYPASYFLARQKAAELEREGRSLSFIAKDLNARGLASASGKPWTHAMVNYRLHGTGHKAEPIDQLHYRLIAEARARRLTYRQIANEFNKKKIRLLGILQTWTARSVERRWTKLNKVNATRRWNISQWPISPEKAS
jgi:DNA invertase Pin-like site-specific DNA recombinase